MTDLEERTSQPTDAVAEVTGLAGGELGPRPHRRASGGSASAWPAGRRRGCPRTPTARACTATTASPCRTPSPSSAPSARPGGLGLLLAAPTIATHGTQEQIDLYVRDIVTGQKAWCQLFSEPGAGSDLAGLQTKAIKDGDEWIVTGQKVWTSGGQVADLGMLIARTDPDVPKHQGITYFAIDMHQPGVEIRPLVEMTGHAMFNEVFMEEAVVPDSALIGGLNNGWAVANTTLMNERAGLGSGGGQRGRRRGHARHGRQATSTSGPATSCRGGGAGAAAAAAGGGMFGASVQAARRPGQGQRQDRATRPSARTSCSCTRSASSAASTTCGPRRPRPTGRTSPACPTSPSSR